LAVILALALKVAVRVAVNEAKTPDEGFAFTYVYVWVPVMGTFEFRNCTAPVGATPRLAVLTVAVRVTDWVGVTVVELAATVMLVVAGVTVIVAVPWLVL